MHTQSHTLATKRAMKVITDGSSRNCHINMTTFSMGTLSPAPDPNTSSTSWFLNASCSSWTVMLISISRLRRISVAQ